MRVSSKLPNICVYQYIIANMKLNKIKNVHITLKNMQEDRALLTTKDKFFSYAYIHATSESNEH